MTPWQTAIYFVYKLSLNYFSFKAIAGCPLNSSSSRTACGVPAHTARSVRNRLWPIVQISSQKDSGLQIHGIQTPWTITCGVQCWRFTASLKQSQKQSPNSRNRFRLSGATYHKEWSDGERLLKLSDWRLALELGAIGGHFEHSQWQWKSGIWSSTI